MAMSRADKPLAPSRQPASEPPEKITWITGQSASAKGPSCGRPGAATEKPVALSTTSGGTCASSSPNVAAESGSFRLDTKTGSGFSPSARKPSQSASIAATLPAWTKAR